MKREPTNEPAPAYDKRVELAIQRLDADLQRALGEGTEYALVILQDCQDARHVQAVTNTTPARAHVLLRAADACGFDSLN